MIVETTAGAEYAAQSIERKAECTASQCETFPKLDSATQHFLHVRSRTRARANAAPRALRGASSINSEVPLAHCDCDLQNTERAGAQEDALPLDVRCVSKLAVPTTTRVTTLWLSCAAPAPRCNPETRIKPVRMSALRRVPLVRKCQKQGKHDFAGCRRHIETQSLANSR